MAIPGIVFGLGGAGIAAVLGYLYLRGSSSSQPANAIAAAAAGDKDGCTAGTADGKAGVNLLNPTDVTSNPELATTAKASGDPVTYLSHYGTSYEKCKAAAKPAPVTPVPPPVKEKVAVDCSKSSTWPSDVQAMWNNYEMHKADGATSAYAKSGEASKLYGRFLSLGCSGNAATVQKTIQSWIDGGGVVTGGPDCHDDSTWPDAIANAYKLYLSDPRGYVDASGGAGLVSGLNSIGCPGTAAAVQHTIDLEIAAGNLNSDGSPKGGASTGGGGALVGLARVFGTTMRHRPPTHYADRFREVRVGQTMADDWPAPASGTRTKVFQSYAAP